MKLLIIHLSDAHFNNNYSFSQDNVKSIISAIKGSIIDTTNALIIVSGDLSFSGQKDQMDCFYNFINSLVDELKKKNQFKSVDVSIVPGNHDVDCSFNKISSDELKEISKKNNFEEYILSEEQKLNEFFLCANHLGCFKDSKLIDQKTYVYDGKKICVNMINTAIFSSLDADQGFHYLPDEEINKLKRQFQSDYVFTVMHHPHQWFIMKSQIKLEKMIYSRSDLVFVGHKHYESVKNISDNESSVNIMAGGMLSNCGSWKDSTFHAGILDLDTRHFNFREYCWNENGKIYISMDGRDITISKDRYNEMDLSVRKEFLKEKIYADKNMISENFQDYFVFPSLEEERIDDSFFDDSRTITEMDSFIAKLNNVKKIVITGRTESGKSLLAKSVFINLMENKTVIYVNGANINNDFERSIKDAFEDIYGNNLINYEIFRQAEPTDVAIIVDNIDAVDISYRDLFIEYINRKFGIIVETCQYEIELDITSRLKKRRINRDCALFKIESFYVNKRRELVTKIINIIHTGTQETKNRIINTLCDALSRQKMLYNLNPNFIVQFTKYYYNNIGDNSPNDGNVFSKVFEANIASILKPFVKRMTVDKILFIIDKIAYDAYCQKEYPITNNTMYRVIEMYNSDYDANVDERVFVNMLVEAHILKETDGGYYFFERTYFAYFTAREIRRRCIEDCDFEQFNYAMEYAYKGLNADVLLFVTYIADNLSIIKKIMEIAEDSVAKWDKFSLTPINISYLNSPARDIIKPVDESDIEKEEEKRVEAEREEAQSMVLVNDCSIFDGETDELSFIQEMIRAMSLMNIISRTLPNFEHLMRKDDKDKCVELIYTMPLKIFYVWACEVDKCRSEIVYEIKEFHEWEYRKDNNKYDFEPLTDDEALYYMLWESMSLLLELMNASISNSTRDNTWQYIDKFEYKSETMFKIEHLMSLAKQNKTELFIKEAELLFNEIRYDFGKTMIKRVAHKYMVSSRNISNNDIQKLNSKLFGQKLKSSHLLIEKGKNKNKY